MPHKRNKGVCHVACYGRTTLVPLPSHGILAAPDLNSWAAVPPQAVERQRSNLVAGARRTQQGFAVVQPPDALGAASVPCFLLELTGKLPASLGSRHVDLELHFFLSYAETAEVDSRGELHLRQIRHSYTSGRLQLAWEPIAGEQSLCVSSYLQSGWRCCKVLIDDF